MASGECTRELLHDAIDAYFVALAAHEPAMLNLADGSKFTENGEVVEIGSAGLWLGAGEVVYSHSALDTEACSVATQAVVPEDGMDIPLAVRLRLVGGQISEVETIAVRPGDYKVSGNDFASNPEAIIEVAAEVMWEEPVPMDQRATREELTGWMNKYYRMFPRGVCDVTDDCLRLENGGGSFDCGLGAGCDPGTPDESQAELDPRLILADEEAGIGVGFTMFQDNTDMHMFKMYAGQVHGVQAILGAAPSSGWD